MDFESKQELSGFPWKPLPYGENRVFLFSTVYESFAGLSNFCDTGVTRRGGLPDI